MDTPKNIFAIYYSKDTDLAHSFLSQLKALENDFNITIWDDDIIYPEQAWKPKNPSRLDNTDVFLLLVSNAFMHSQFIQQIEFKMVIDRYKEGKAEVIPILLDKCPWDTEFNSDDYDFSFKELQVLPRNRKPIREWNSIDKALNHVVHEVNREIIPEQEKTKQEEHTSVPETSKGSMIEEQATLNLEETEVISSVEKEAKSEEAIQIKQRIEEERKLQEEASRRREKEIEIRNQAKRKAEQAIKQKEEERAKQIALEEQQKKEKVKQTRVATTTEVSNEAPEKEKNINLKNKALIAITAVLAIIGIWFFSNGDKPSEKPERTLPKVEDTAADKNYKVEKPKVEAKKREVLLSKLSIGDSHAGGIVFDIDTAGKKGIVVSYDDEGPMPWNMAINIHEKLGEGWRLPTLNELKAMRKTIGQGADNTGEFSDGLYWSATLYDEYQARLLRFRDGNTSYHYNKAVETRQFRVRAVRDFSR